MIQQTLVLIKPDGVARGLIGNIIQRFEQRGLKIIALKLVKIDIDHAKQHYTEDITERHGENVRNSLLSFITGGPIVAMIIEGVHAIKIVRKIVGNTFPGDADLGTIRGDFCHMSKDYSKGKNKPENVVHASADETDAKKEIALWFSIDEIHDYKRAGEEHFL
jgi:nucleoside-diphosphate kinase